MLEKGLKHDQGKLRFDLVPPEALEKIVEVLNYGANKYDDRNWENGINYGRCFAACMRHLWAWWRREKNDSESGIPHLAHAACNLLFLLHYEINEMIDHDDRPFKWKILKPEEMLND